MKNLFKNFPLGPAASVASIVAGIAAVLTYFHLDFSKPDPRPSADPNQIINVNIQNNYTPPSPVLTVEQNAVSNNETAARTKPRESTTTQTLAHDGKISIETPASSTAKQDDFPMIEDEPDFHERQYNFDTTILPSRKK